MMKRLLIFLINFFIFAQYLKMSLEDIKGHIS